MNNHREEMIKWIGYKRRVGLGMTLKKTLLFWIFSHFCHLIHYSGETSYNSHTQFTTLCKQLYCIIRNQTSTCRNVYFVSLKLHPSKMTKLTFKQKRYKWLLTCSFKCNITVMCATYFANLENLVPVWRLPLSTQMWLLKAVRNCNTVMVAC
jgi:hypothetical protein